MKSLDPWQLPLDTVKFETRTGHETHGISNGDRVPGASERESKSQVFISHQKKSGADAVPVVISKVSDYTALYNLGICGIQFPTSS